MNSDSTAKRVEFHRRVLHDAGFVIAPGCKILDLGCGEGETVKAFRAASIEAFGCDIELSGNDSQGLLHLIDGRTGRIPFDDETFDFVISEQVFEHVMDYEPVLAEIRRVLKPGGVSLHGFPARWRPIEGHVYVPFAGVIRSKLWLTFWSFLGIRNEFQKGLSFREVARLNFDYLHTHTHYLPETEIKAAFGRYFDHVQFAEMSLIKHGYGRSRFLFPIVKRVPSLVYLYRNFNQRLVLARKYGDVAHSTMTGT